MKICILTLFIFGAATSYSQSAFVSVDSTQLVFPDHVEIRFSRLPQTKGKSFQISSGNLKILMTEINFLLNRLKLEQDNVVLYRANEEILKSSAGIMEKKYMAEVERTLLHKNAFESLEKVSGTYHIELQNCKSDLDTLSRKNTRARKSGFLKGMIWGVIVGGVLGIVVDVK
jgi:hypothetical protein